MDLPVLHWKQSEQIVDLTYKVKMPYFYQYQLITCLEDVLEDIACSYLRLARSFFPDVLGQYHTISPSDQLTDCFTFVISPLGEKPPETKLEARWVGHGK